MFVRRLREGKITKEQLDLARVAIPSTLLLVSLAELFDPAVEIAVRTGEGFYDALYIATALRWDTVVVTADAQLVASLAGGPGSERAVMLDEWPAARAAR